MRPGSFPRPSWESCLTRRGQRARVLCVQGAPRTCPGRVAGLWGLRVKSARDERQDSVTICGLCPWTWRSGVDTSGDQEVHGAAASPVDTRAEKLPVPGRSCSKNEVMSQNKVRIHISVTSLLPTAIGVYENSDFISFLFNHFLHSCYHVCLHTVS